MISDQERSTPPLKVNPVVLVGGAGTRLWPLSRRDAPKPLIPLLDNEETLFQRTLQRLDGLNLEQPVIVCNETHRFLVSEQACQAGQKPAVILAEPEGRNTAPALTLAALSLSEGGQDGLMLVLPADHAIDDVAAFHSAVKEGTLLAQEGKVVTFGIVPDSANTGYGYIRRGEGYKVAEYVEKPDPASAQKYVASGDYLWNSGMFVVKASVWLQEIQEHHANILDQCQKAYDQGNSVGGFHQLEGRAFSACPSNSIDYAVMEKTDRAAVVPLAAGWSDVGDWASFYAACERDLRHNVVRGDVITHETRDCLLLASNRLLATVGLKDLVVVETADAVLVAAKDKSQQVKELVKTLQHQARSEVECHRTVHKPWGAYEVIDRGEGFQVKRLSVNPGAVLSLQKHAHRSEHWVVVQGTAKVTRNDEVFLLEEDESTYIPLGAIHRLENPGTTLLQLIEVQSGAYLGEDDIVRLEDRYERKSGEAG